MRKLLQNEIRISFNQYLVLEIYSTEPRRDIDMRRFFEESVQMVRDGLINTTEIVTHTFPLSQIGEGFALRNKGDFDTIHVLVDCEA